MIFLFFFIVKSNYENSMYPRSFLCEEGEIKQRTPLEKKLCEIGEEAIWASRFTSFFFFFQVEIRADYSSDELIDPSSFVCECRRPGGACLTFTPASHSRSYHYFHRAVNLIVERHIDTRE